MEVLQQIFELCIVPLLGVLTTYLVKVLNKKTLEIETTTDNELSKKYIELLSNTISECVISTNQTYVESLKNKNAFTKENQEEAFKMTYEKVIQILTEEAKTYLANIYGDLDKYITTKIESEVSLAKINTNENVAAVVATAAVTAVKEIQEGE